MEDSVSADFESKYGDAAHGNAACGLSYVKDLERQSYEYLKGEYKNGSFRVVMSTLREYLAVLEFYILTHKLLNVDDDDINTHADLVDNKKGENAHPEKPNSDPTLPFLSQGQLAHLLHCLEIYFQIYSPSCSWKDWLSLSITCKVGKLFINVRKTRIAFF